MPRLFIAIELPAFWKDALDELREPLPGFSWTPKENFHLTLKFIGEVHDELVDPIAEALEALAVEPFLLEAEGVDCFRPKRRPPSVVWVGMRKAHPRLFALQKRINDALFMIGVEPDLRIYEPHITLARTTRAKGGAVEQFVKKHRAFGLAPFWVEQFTLFESIRTSARAIHEPMRRYDLASNAA